MVRVMVLSIAIITVVYLLVNVAMLRVLGVGGMAGSDAVGAELMRRVAGERSAILVSLLVGASAVASINAMIFTCARTSYALGRDFPLFAPLGRWRARGSVPANALLFQGAIIVALIVFGARTRQGFKTMVEYTAPVFWLFVFLTTLSLIRLRRKNAAVPRAYSVPLYPWTPVLFAAICAYLFYSSVVYTGIGALVGLGVVAAGVPVLLLSRRASPHHP
jgi:amino acid transporter